METPRTMKTRSFEVTLGYFVATVTITEDPPSPRRYHCIARFNTRDPGLATRRPFDAHAASADDLLDLLEAISLSNELLEELLLSGSPKRPNLKLVKPARSGGDDA